MPREAEAEAEGRRWDAEGGSTLVSLDPVRLELNLPTYEGRRRSWCIADDVFGFNAGSSRGGGRGV